MKKILFFTVILAVMSLSCNSMAGKEQKKQVNDGDGIVISAVNGAGYTFLELKADKGNYWAATREIEVKKGDVVKLINPMLMKKFEAKSLSKIFDEIYFVDSIVVNGKVAVKKTDKAVSPHGSMAKGGGNGHMADSSEVDVSKVEKAKDGVTINEILTNPTAFKGKEVVINAVITKYLPEIMGRNWLHLKDASSKEVHIAAITDEKFNKGDIVLIKGTVVLDKDFGHGYKYKVLVDNVVSVKK